jgi:hypothetical protein
LKKNSILENNTSGPNLISTFSPVNEALFTLRSVELRILKSAGTLSPLLLKIIVRLFIIFLKRFLILVLIL